MNYPQNSYTKKIYQVYNSCAHKAVCLLRAVL